MIPLFDSFTLNTTKYLDYLAFRQVVMLRESEAHLTPEGIERIVSLKSSMNKACTEFTLPSDLKVVVTFP